MKMKDTEDTNKFRKKTNKTEDTTHSARKNPESIEIVPDNDHPYEVSVHVVEK